MNDRLLTQDEIFSMPKLPDLDELLQAQDAKTAKHYEEVVIPAQIAEAIEPLQNEIERLKAELKYADSELKECYREMKSMQNEIGDLQYEARH